MNQQRNLTFCLLSEAQFTHFIQDSALITQRSFLQSPQLKKVLEERRGGGLRYVGVIDGDKVVAGCLLKKVPAKRPFGFFFEIDGGPYLDYDNEELVAFFFTQLKKFCKAEKGLSVRFSPNITYQTFDGTGQALSEKNEAVFQTILQTNARHIGFSRGYDERKPNWYYVKDLSGLTAETLCASFKKRRFEKVKKYGIHVRKLSFYELNAFKEITSKTALDRGFQDKDGTFYRLIFKHFGKHARYYGSYLDFADCLHTFSQEKKILEEKIAKLSAKNEKTPSQEKQLADCNNQLNAVRKRESSVLHLKETHGGDALLLAVALFFVYPNEIVFFSGGSREGTQDFYGAHLIHEHMMREAIAQGIPRYNFYGISGNFDGSDGVLRFKEGFNGIVEEKMGTFILEVAPCKMKLYRILKKIRQFPFSSSK